jgi:hypothetical protein
LNKRKRGIRFLLESLVLIRFLKVGDAKVKKGEGRGGDSQGNKHCSRIRDQRTYIDKYKN